MRLKWLVIPAFMIGTIFLMSEDSQGQFRGPPDPNKSFDDMARKTTGGTDFIDYGKIPPEERERTNGFLRARGMEPMPDSGTVNRQQYTEQFNKRMEAMMKSGGFGGNRGGDRGGDRGNVGVPPQGGQATPNSDEDTMRRFKERDRNQDGKISMEEASQFLKPVFAQYDTDRDGFVNFEEYKGYMVAFNQQATTGRGLGNGDQGRDRGADRGSFGGQPQQQGGNTDNRDMRDDRKSREKEEEIARPVVYRFGKLPKELPSWFEKYDKDLDGQVGLYEWRREGDVTAKFVEMDLNADGYLTAEEWLRFTKQQLEKKPVTLDENGDLVENPSRGSSQSASSRSSGDQRRPGGDRPQSGSYPNRDEKKDEKKDEKNSKKNPFSAGK